MTDLFPRRRVRRHARAPPRHAGPAALAGGRRPDGRGALRRLRRSGFPLPIVPVPRPDRALGAGSICSSASAIRRTSASAPRRRSLLLAYDVLQLGGAPLPHRRPRQPLRDPAARAGHRLGDDAAAAADRSPRRPGGRRRERCSRVFHLPLPWQPGERSCRSRSIYVRRRLDGAGLGLRLHRRLRLPRRRGGAPARQGAERHRDGARPRAASLRARRARRGRRARARHAARHHRAGRQGAGARVRRRAAPHAEDVALLTQPVAALPRHPRPAHLAVGPAWTSISRACRCPI